MWDINVSSCSHSLNCMHTLCSFRKLTMPTRYWATRRRRRSTTSTEVWDCRWPISSARKTSRRTCSCPAAGAGYAPVLHCHYLCLLRRVGILSKSVNLAILTFVNFAASVLISIAKRPVSLQHSLHIPDLTTVTLCILQFSKVSNKSSTTDGKIPCSRCRQKLLSLVPLLLSNIFTGLK